MSSVNKMSIGAIVDPIDRILTRLSPFAVGVVGASCVYYVAFSYGVGVVFVVLGREQSAQLLGNTAGNPLKVLVGVPLIPFALITLEAMDTEGRLLYLWREKISPQLSQLPLVGQLIDRYWPTPSREPLRSTQNDLTGGMDYLARSMSAGLLLPFAAYVVGIGLKHVTNINSRTKRVLLGGILYYSVKAIVKLYLRQEEYRRQGFRRVLDYNHNMHNTSAQTE